MIEYERRGDRGKLIVGKYIPPYIHTSNDRLSKEEALYLMEQNKLYCTFNSAPISIQQAYSIWDIDLNSYTVYQHLRGKGYHVFRRLSYNTSKSTPASNFSIALKPRNNLLCVHNYYSERILRKDLNIFLPATKGQSDFLEYEVYYPSSKFSKSKRGAPDFRVIVFSQANFFDLKTLQNLIDDGSPIKIAISDCSSINLLIFFYFFFS